MTKKNLKVIYISGIIFFFSLLVSYAYFSSVLKVENGPHDIIAETGTLLLDYQAGPEISMLRAFPGDYLLKDITVENVGSLEAVYTIFLSDIINTITNNEIAISATCTSNTDTCEDIISQNIISSGVQTVKGNIAIGVGEKHTYRLKVLFKETGSIQNYNQGQQFSGKIQINEYVYNESSVPSLAGANIDNQLLTAVVTDSVGIIAYSVKEASSVTPEPWTNLEEATSLLNLNINVDDYDKKIWVKDVDGNVVYEDLTPKPQLIVNPDNGVWEGSTSARSFNMTYKEEREISDPEREGYTFTGWDVSGERSTLTDAIAFSKSKYSLNRMSTNNEIASGSRKKIFKMGIETTYLTANWEADSFTLSIDPNGGTWNSSSIETNIPLAPNGTQNVPDPVRTGYTFTGWSESDDSACNLNSTIFTMGNEDCTLTATWLVNDYPWIAYHKQQTVDGANYTLISADTENGNSSYGSVITPSVKTYTGFTSPSLQSITIGVDTTTPASVNVVNYNYVRKKYNLSIYPTGGVWNGTSSNSIINNVYYQSTRTIADPTRTGYNFNSWTLSGTGSSLSARIFTMGTKNASLTASWNAITMTVTFNPNGGSVGTTTKSVSYDSAYGTLPVPTRSGFTFDGWHLGSASGTTITSSSTVTNTTSHTLYAAWKSPTLKEKMLIDNNESSDSGINFAQISSSSNGLGLYYNADSSNGETIYYYRGAVTNNYLKFAGYCWRIIRTTEDGSIKLRFGGTPNGNNCPQTGTNVNIGVTPFNTDDDDAADSFYINAGGTSYNYSHATQNMMPSDIAALVNNWYYAHIYPYTAYTSLLSHTTYCADRSIHSASSLFGITNTKRGYGQNDTIWNSFGKVLDNYLNGTTLRPSFQCPQENDLYSTYQATSGNHSIQYPIALITLDEAIYAGNVFYTQNPTNYLTTGKSYWTMTPAYFNHGAASVAAIDITGALYEDLAETLWGTIWWDETEPEPSEDAVAVPVIAVKDTVEVTSGTGAYNSPYIIQ